MNEMELRVSIEKARNYLQNLWDTKNKTDSEILQAAEEFDRLINMLGYK